MIFVKYSPVKLLFTNQKKKKKNHTHVKKVGHNSEFLFGELLMNLKNNYSLSGPIKNVRILILTLYFFSKNKEKHLQKTHHLIVFPDVYTVNTVVWEI